MSSNKISNEINIGSCQCFNGKEGAQTPQYGGKEGTKLPQQGVEGKPHLPPFENGDTILHWATNRNNFADVKRVLEQGADVHALNSDKKTALQLAIAHGFTEIVDLLLGKSGTLLVEDDLISASTGGHLTTVQLILERAPNLNMNLALCYASRQGHLSVVKFLVERGQSLSLGININHNTDKHIGSPLNASARSGRIDVVRFLVDVGADINIVCSYGYTPLGDASFTDHIDVVRYLIEHGADVNKFAIHHASYWGNHEIIKILLEHGADVNAVNTNRETPLTCIASHMGFTFKLPNYLKSIRILLEYGADVNAVGRNGSILHQVNDIVSHRDWCGKEHTTIQELLIEHKALAIAP